MIFLHCRYILVINIQNNTRAVKIRFFFMENIVEISAVSPKKNIYYIPRIRHNCIIII